MMAGRVKYITVLRSLQPGMRSELNVTQPPQAMTRSTAGDGLYSGSLARGCTQCVRGAKMVLFVTGVCDMGCFYCPVSFRRNNRDVVYANERLVTSDADILEEARSMRALGTGITGGDPLIVPERTARYIRLLKQAFGPRHHIHLYTGRPNVQALSLLAVAGLDEIRVHPPESIWTRFQGTGFEKMLLEARRLGMRAGVEVPALPGLEEELASMIEAASRAGAQFVNLNELEMSETNAAAFRSRGYELANDYSNAILGSDGIAREVVSREFSIPVHYCPSTFKDSVQLRERIRRMASVVRWSGELVTGEGTLIKGVVETADPVTLSSRLAERFDIPPKYIRADSKRGRVEIAPWIAEEIGAELDETCYLVEEYPTSERTEVERRAVRQR